MKVFYDHQIFEWQKFGGISRYFIELINSYNQDDVGIQALIDVKYSINEYLLESNYNNSVPKSLIEVYDDFLFKFNFRGKNRIFEARNQIFRNLDPLFINKKSSIDSINNSKFDIFHPTYYDNYFLPYLKRKPFVLTIYDMIHEKFPESFLNMNIIQERKKELAKKATRIVAISNNTKKDIIEILGIDESKIDVVHLASSLYYNPAIPAKLKNLPERYLLFIGERALYKNFTLFIEVVAKIIQKDPSLYVICSGREFSIVELSMLEKMKIKNNIVHIFAKDNDLAYLYSHALAFVYPSLYEGFGIPILEAFNCGCPVILNNKGSLPEVGGDAAIYFDSDNSSSLFLALEKILYGDKTYRNSIIEKGYGRAKDFSWNKTAKQMSLLYQSVC